jgi:hypothetical protein
MDVFEYSIRSGLFWYERGSKESAETKFTEILNNVKCGIDILVSYRALSNY